MNRVLDAQPAHRGLLVGSNSGVALLARFAPPGLGTRLGGARVGGFKAFVSTNRAFHVYMLSCNYKNYKWKTIFDCGLC